MSTGREASCRVQPGSQPDVLTAYRYTRVAGASESVTMCLDTQGDRSRGDVLAAADAPPQAADQKVGPLVHRPPSGPLARAIK